MRGRCSLAIERLQSDYKSCLGKAGGSPFGSRSPDQPTSTLFARPKFYSKHFIGDGAHQAPIQIILLFSALNINMPYVITQCLTNDFYCCVKYFISRKRRLHLKNIKKDVKRFCLIRIRLSCISFFPFILIDFNATYMEMKYFVTFLFFFLLSILALKSLNT